jgi:hypothetical protein
MNTASQLATLALEFWRASGARTTERLSALVSSTAEAYYGSPAKWAPETAALVADARQMAASKVRAWEVR